MRRPKQQKIVKLEKSRIIYFRKLVVFDFTIVKLMMF